MQRMKKREGEFIDEIVRVVKDNNYYLLFSGGGEHLWSEYERIFPIYSKCRYIHEVLIKI